MNKIVYLATTKGCVACTIMERILKEVHQLNVYPFSIEIRDFNDLPVFIRINVPLHDFPVLIFVKDDVIKYHVNGTISAKKLQNIIKDIQFD